MSTAPTPSVPNVVIKNPNARNAIYSAFGWVSLAVFVAVAVDAAAPELDYTNITTPVLAGLSVLGAGIGYTASKNTPTYN